MATTTITIDAPASNTAAEWNQAIKTGAEKVGIELPVPGAKVAEPSAAAAPKKEDEPVIHEAIVNINGKDMVFRDADPSVLVKQITAAVEAAQPVAAAPAKEEPKPKFTDAELFDISLGLQKGDTKALDNYIVKSGVINTWLESQGVSIDTLKAATTKVQSNDLNERWKDATEKFTAKVRAGESDYPGGAQNTYLMGIMLAELGLTQQPSVESFELAYEELKKRNMVFPVAAAGKEGESSAGRSEQPGKKRATSSTAVGSAGGQESRQVAVDPKSKVELDITQLSTRQAGESYNELIRRGYKPEQIVVKQ